MACPMVFSGSVGQLMGAGPTMMLGWTPGSVLLTIGLAALVAWGAMRLARGGAFFSPGASPRLPDQVLDRLWPAEETPRMILDRRYAAGEIDHDEYQRRRRELS